MQNEITLEDFKTVLGYLINNNRRLVDDGKFPISVGICGEAGVGKTTMIKDFANENKMTFIKLNISELEEIGDLTGFPIKEYKINELNEDGSIRETKWVPHDLINTYFQKPCETYNITDESRMSYASPAWLPREDNPNGTILLIDDFTRGNSLFMQAIMELICTGKYISWNLPKYTTVCLSSNPDDGSYSVTSLDPAQQSRFINFNIKWDLDGWARWAEEYKLEGRGINFALSYPEIFESKDGVNKINSRSYTMFINAISGIDDWSKSENLALILNVAKGAFPFDKENIVGGMFTTFIANKLDKLITPKDMLTGDWKTIKSQIMKCVYDGDKYRPEIASVLATRLLNYSVLYLSQKGSKTNVVQDRLLEIIESKEKLFSEDLIFHVTKTLVTKFPTKTNKLLLNSTIRAKILN